MTSSQRQMLKHIERWGELTPDINDELNCKGAAVRSVLASVIRRGWVHEKNDDVCWCLVVTDAGRNALAAAN